jgi:hypothetical protein
MNQQSLIESLASSVGKVPSETDVIALQQFTLDDMEGRTKRLLAQIGAKEERSLERGAWEATDKQTLVRLPLGARAVLYHASGSMKYVSGLAPLESLFERVDSKERLTALVQEASKKFSIHDWAGSQGELAFERLWQTRAQGADRSGRTSEAVLCRIVGAFRHSINGVPVLGPASVALKLAGDGRLDALEVQVRPSASEVLDKARIIDPVQAARQLSLQLSNTLGYGKTALPDNAIESQKMHFGYFNLGKRKSQRLLAPVYIAQVILRHKEETQALAFAVSASEKSYLPISQYGEDPAASRPRSGRPTKAPATETLRRKDG